MTAMADFERLVRDGIKPHADDLESILRAGHFAVVVFEPTRGTQQTADALGAKGRTCFGVTPAKARQRIGPISPAARRWSKRPSRASMCVVRLGIYALTRDVAFLINFVPGAGYTLEPEPIGFDPRDLTKEEITDLLR